jgi:hypothetical protein
LEEIWRRFSALPSFLAPVFRSMRLFGLNFTKTLRRDRQFMNRGLC